MTELRPKRRVKISVQLSSDHTKIMRNIAKKIRESKMELMDGMKLNDKVREQKRKNENSKTYSWKGQTNCTIKFSQQKSLEDNSQTPFFGVFASKVFPWGFLVHYEFFYKPVRKILLSSFVASVALKCKFFQWVPHIYSLFTGTKDEHVGCSKILLCILLSLNTSKRTPWSSD